MLHSQVDNQAYSSSHSFDSAHALSPNHIRCEDPYDLRPAADIVVNAIQEKLEEIPENEKLVVLISSIHSMSSHIEFQHMVLSRLQTSGENFTMNFELPNNFLPGMIKNKMQITVPDEMHEKLGELDKDGQLLLTGFLGHHQIGEAPEAHADLMAFCKENHIASQFSDAATDGVALDMSDPATAQIAKDLNLEDRTIDYNDPMLGTALRNQVMANLGLAHAETRGTRLIVQETGLDHMFGSNAGGDPYERSLSVAYNRPGVHVLPVVLATNKTGYGLETLPQEAHRKLQEAVIVEGLAEEEFFTPKRSSLERKPYKEGAEKDFITKLHDASGGEITYYKVASQKSTYKELARRRLIDAFEQAAKPANEKSFFVNVPSCSLTPS